MLLAIVASLFWKLEVIDLIAREKALLSRGQARYGIPTYVDWKPKEPFFFKRSTMAVAKQGRPVQCSANSIDERLSPTTGQHQPCCERNKQPSFGLPSVP